MKTRPRIVILDGYTANPGDLDWAPVRALGDCAIHPRTPPERVVERAGDAEIVLTNKVVFDRAAIEALPRLRYIGVTATGYNIIDLSAARERGVVVTNVPAYSTPSVVQAVFALLFELTNHTGLHDGAARSGKWSQAPDFCFWERPIQEVAGKTIGLVGLGHIGQGVARAAQAFEMKVIAFSRSGRSVPRVALRSLDDLFAESDVVSLHCPLTTENTRMVNAARLGRMKPSAFLINTARGQLIDEPALADALNREQIAGAALDVLSVEPPPPDHPLLTARNCLITPHIAWASRESRQRLITQVAENIRAFLVGTPINTV